MRNARVVSDINAPTDLPPVIAPSSHLDSPLPKLGSQFFYSFADLLSYAGAGTRVAEMESVFNLIKFEGQLKHYNPSFTRVLLQLQLNTLAGV